MPETTSGGTPRAGGAEPSSDSLDLFSTGQDSDFSEEEEQEVSEARYRQSHRSRRPAEPTQRNQTPLVWQAKLHLTDGKRFPKKREKQRSWTPKSPLC